MQQPLQNKSEKQVICELFDSFVKTALRRKSRNLVRDYLRRLKYEEPVWDVENYEKDGIIEQDENGIPNDLVVDQISYRIQCEELYMAFLSLDEKEKTVLILQYWHNMRDVEIAEHCHISTRAVRKRRRKGIQQLREYMMRGDAMTDAAGCEDHQ